MKTALWGGVFLVLAGVSLPADAAPRVTSDPRRLVVTAPEYRLTIDRHQCQMQLELCDEQGNWRAVTKKGTSPEFAVVDAHGFRSSTGTPATVRYEAVGDTIVVGTTFMLPAAKAQIAHVHFVCTDDGILMRFEPEVGANQPGTSVWALPRLILDEGLFDAYAYWRAPDEMRPGLLMNLGTPTTYVGTSSWGSQGDTAPRLSKDHPAIVARSSSAKVGLGVVLVSEETTAAGSHAFLQQYSRDQLFFYPLITTRAIASKGAWGWLAPMPFEVEKARAKVERLMVAGNAFVRDFRPIAPAPEEYWTKPVPDFPVALRHAQPVSDINRAIVYTINETINDERGMDLARKSGSDLLIRAWFKWATPPDYTRLAPMVKEAHAMGSLFGGGITCSALYHGENGLTEQQVLNMATRGASGQLIDAWGEANCRHGSLSNPAYLEYLLSSCKKQIDLGADYLFMDEINAALQADEGFDDASIADFRQFLLDRYGKQGWKPDDPRWKNEREVGLGDRTVAPDGTMATFQYREYLKEQGLSSKPLALENPLVGDWHGFREARDDRAWKWLSDAIRSYAAGRGQRVLLSGNGIAKYVDLQVLGVWENWPITDGRVDLSVSQIEEWGSTVAAGWGLAGRKLPVVLFHDWGFGGFPWMEVPPEDRRLWIRVRGAEIYAAGGFFAFPVHGPMSNDSSQDGTLGEIVRQSAFYHQHEKLYLDGELLGFEPLKTDEAGLSVALWRRTSPPGLVLHVINRQVQDVKPKPRTNIVVRLPVAAGPKAVHVVSPDWDGEKAGKASVTGGELAVTIPELEAYSVAILDYDALPTVQLSERRIIPAAYWIRPARNEFAVLKGGLVRDQWALPGMLQGRLHGHLRNPPTFVVNMPRGGSLKVFVRGVAMQGARLEWRVDGRAAQTFDLPDRDGKNESTAHEYDQVYELTIPAGRHRLTLDNVGGDWACIGWYAFTGEIEDQ